MTSITLVRRWLRQRPTFCSSLCRSSSNAEAVQTTLKGVVGNVDGVGVKVTKASTLMNLQRGVVLVACLEVGSNAEAESRS